MFVCLCAHAHTTGFNEASKHSWMNTLSKSLQSLTYRLNSNVATVTLAALFLSWRDLYGFYTEVIMLSIPYL